MIHNLHDKYDEIGIYKINFNAYKHHCSMIHNDHAWSSRVDH